MREKIRNILILSMVVILSMGASFASAAYPEKPIKLIVPFPPGGATDALTRIYIEYVAKYLGQRLFIVNISGGGGEAGANEFAASTPDGYTLIGATDPTYLVQLIQHKPQFTFDGLHNLIAWSADPAVLTVNKDSPINSLKDLLKRATAEPGKISMGTGTAYNHHAFAANKLLKMSAAKFTVVPFQGGAAAITALLGGHIATNMANLSDVYRRLDQLRVLAIATKKRHTLLPDVPTFSEQGFNIVEQLFRFITVQRETPKDRVEILRAALEKARDNPEFQEAMKKAGSDVPMMSYAELQTYLSERFTELKSVIPQELEKK